MKDRIWDAVLPQRQASRTPFSDQTADRELTGAWQTLRAGSPRGGAS